MHCGNIPTYLRILSSVAFHISWHLSSIFVVEINLILDKIDSCQGYQLVTSKNHHSLAYLTRLVVLAKKI